MGEVSSATSHWEFQDFWSLILKVHRAMALTCLSPETQLRGCQVIRNLSLLRSERHKVGWDYSRYSISLPLQVEMEEPWNEWRVECTPNWSGHSVGSQQGASKLEGHPGSIQRAMANHRSNVDIQGVGLQVLDILCPPGWTRNRLSADRLDWQHDAIGIHTRSLPSLVEVRVRHTVAPILDSTWGTAQPRMSVWVPLDGTINDIIWRPLATS